MDGQLDTCIPSLTNQCLDIYFPIDGEPRPGALFNDGFTTCLTSFTPPAPLAV
jgi:hypothetical protein